jgi:4-amino-4-deoxy-L-arabinose transferase-like glycosyltransferase
VTARRLLLALLAAHAAVLFLHSARAYSGPDASGYFVQARLIATEGRSWLRQESPAQFIGVHWLETADGRFFSRYPPGLPVALAGVYRALGPAAALAVVPLLATLAVALTFLLARPLAGDRLALLASAAMATNGVLNERALAFDAHTAALATLLAGFVLLVQWARRPQWLTALAAGLVLGLLPAIRYGEGVCGLGAAAFLLVQWRRGRPPAHVALAALGAALPIAALLTYHRAAFGALTATGYALTHEQAAFDFMYLRFNAVPYLRALLVQGPGLFLVLGLAGILAMLKEREDRPLALLLLGAALPLALVYGAYYWPGGVPSLRFLLPSFPLYIVAGVWLLHRSLGARRGPWLALAAVACAVQLGIGVVQSARLLASRRDELRAAAAVARWATDHVSAGSVIAASSAVQETLWYTGRWKLGDGDLLAGLQPPEDVPAAVLDVPDPAQRRVDAVRLRSLLLPDSVRVRQLLRELATWAGPHRDVFWLVRGRQKPPAALVLVGEVPLPAPAGLGGPDWFSLASDPRPLIAFRLPRSSP